MNKNNSYDISEVYFNLLKHFPFSITGYEDEEHEYATFFRRICESDEVISDESIKFLISGFAKLNSENPGFEDWQVEVLKRFLFHDQEKGFPEFILSVYLNALYLLSKNKRAVNIISENVRSNVIIKIEISDETENIHFNYRKRDETLEILIPSKFYKKKNPSHISIDSILKNSKHKNTPLLVKESTQLKSEYQIDDAQLKSKKTMALYNELFKEFMNCSPATFLKEIKQHIPNEKFIDKLKGDVFKNPNFNVEEILKLAYVTSIFCYFYDSSVTYFISTARVKNNQRFTLGGIGVGLSSKANFTRNDLAFFSILANHIAANLSAQYVHDTNENLQFELRRSQQIEILKDFHERCLMLTFKNVAIKKESDVIDHAAHPITKEHLKALHEFKELYEDKLHKCGLLFFKNRVDELFYENNYVDMDLFVSCHHSISKPELRSKCNFITRATQTLGLEISGDNRPYINISLAHYFVTQILEKGDANVVTLTMDNKIIIHTDYSNPFNVSGFLNSLQNAKSGKLSSFIKEHYSDFRIAGNLLIYEKEKYLRSKGNTFPILDLEKQFRKKASGSLLYFGKHLTISETKKITFVIEFYSI